MTFHHIVFEGVEHFDEHFDNIISMEIRKKQMKVDRLLVVSGCVKSFPNFIVFFSNVFLIPFKYL